MKILFLDHDGVICLTDNWNTRQKKWARYRSANPDSSKYLPHAPVQIRFDDFDKKAVRILNEIILETDCEIVVSSDWRAHATLDELGDYYLQQGIVKRPVDFTGNKLPGDAKFWDPKTDLEETRSYEILDSFPNLPGKINTTI